MSSNSLRDRIATALWDIYAPIMGYADQRWDELSEGLRDEFRHDADAVIEALQQPACGGCRGLGGHSPRCHTQPGAIWRRLADIAESLGDRIGSNDTALANDAYRLMGELRLKSNAQERAEDEIYAARKKCGYE